MREHFSSVAITLLLIYGVGAIAQTTDNETQASEDICDELIGLTPGLYGLCVAFNSGQDCEPDFALDDPFQDCKPSSRKLLEIYIKKANPGDPVMPGISDPCLCFADAEILATFPIVERCRDFSAAVDDERDQDGVELYIASPLRVAQALRVNWTTPPIQRCLFIDRTISPNIFRNIEVSDLELQLCDAVVRHYVADQGIECEAFR